MNNKRLLRILRDAKCGYDEAVGSVEQKIKNKIEFNFCIDYQPSDGFVILNIDTANLALFESCIDVINRDKKLTKENHEKISI